MVRFITSLLLVISLGHKAGAAELETVPWTSSMRLELGNDFFVRDLRLLSGGELLVAGDQLILPPVTDDGPEPISSNYVQLHEPDGSLRWQVILPGSGRSAEYGEIAVSLTETDVFLVGQIRHEESTVRNLFVARISIDGEVIWQLELTDEADMVGRAVVAAGDGGAYVAGWYRSTGGTAGYLVRLSAAGEVTWSEWLPNEGESSLDVLVLGVDGSLTVAGTRSRSFSGARTGHSDAVVMTFDPAGQLLWQTQFGSEGTTTPVKLHADGSGILLLGDTFGSLTEAQQGAHDVFVARFDSSGERLWTSQFGGNDNDRALELSSSNPDSIHVAALFASYADAYAPVVTELGLIQVVPGMQPDPAGIEFTGAVGGMAIRQDDKGPVLLLAVNEGDGWYLHEFDPRHIPAD